MKRSSMVLIFFMGSWMLHAELSIANIEKMVKDIRAKRTSKVESNASVASPFIVIRKDENRSVIADVSDKIVATDFVLGGIVNASAFIAGGWRKEGDTIGDFTVDAVADDHVVLKSKNRTITLYFRKTKDIVKMGKE